MKTPSPPFLRFALVVTISACGLSQPLFALDAGQPGQKTFITAATDTRRATPDAALAALKKGNIRFASGKAKDHADNFQRVAATAKNQYPIASVIGCADSRTPPEVIFDLGIGELFVCRVAGVASEINDVASLEYGAEHLGAPLIVVMGHTQCGAMKAAVADKLLPGSLPHLIGSIRPAVERARVANPKADAATLLAAATREQVLGEEAQLLASPVLHELIHEGKLKIVGAIYSVEDGKVTWLGEHPDQEALLGKVSH
jgi:carbonic anhydrase